MQIQHILFPIDFTERCCRAIPYVAAMARRHTAKVTLMSVSEALSYSSLAEPPAAVVINPEEALADLSERLDLVRAECFPGLSVECAARLGDPARAIVDFATREGVDLVMIPTHGLGAFRRLLIGSVTAKVLHDVVCPVWTGAHTADAAPSGRPDSRSIVCAVDEGSTSVALIRWAEDFAANAGARLRLVHIVPGMQGFPSHQMDLAFQERLCANGTQKIHELQEAAGSHSPLTVAAGGVAERVAEEASRHAADLLIIGRGVIQEGYGRLRTHAYGIIRESPCPVLSV
jgi:nucleotide-binding universal stress UspA family protein